MNNKNESLPSERSFGFLFAIVFAGIAAVSISRTGFTTRASILAALSLITFFIAIGRPKLLTPFNRAWFRLGEMLAKIVNPIVMGVMFFAILTPLALVLRSFGRDELRLRKSDESTYWIKRDPPGPTSDSFQNQF